MIPLHYYNTTQPFIVDILGDHFAYVPSQCETMLHCNVASHWLGAYTKWPLHIIFAVLMIPLDTDWKHEWNKCVSMKSLDHKKGFYDNNQLGAFINPGVMSRSSFLQNHVFISVSRYQSVNSNITCLVFQHHSESPTRPCKVISIDPWKTVVSPVLMYWRHLSLALSHWFVFLEREKKTDPRFAEAPVPVWIMPPICEFSLGQPNREAPSAELTGQCSLGELNSSSSAL